MKTMIYSLTLAALMITSFSSCSDDNDPVLTQKDWLKISRLCIYRNTVRTRQALTTRYGR